jgi:hypothetical protein
MSDTPKTDAAIALIDENGELVRANFARHLERDLTKAINCARFMAAYLEDRGENSGRAYALCREIGWPDQS